MSSLTLVSADQVVPPSSEKRMHPHLLRHACATYMLADRAESAHLQESVANRVHNRAEYARKGRGMHLQTKCSLGAILILIASAGVHSEEVCTIPEEQTKRQADAFSKIAVVFTQEPRCVNCHGAIDPFARNTKHGGGQQDRKDNFSSTFKPCLECHIDPAEGWFLPPPAGRDPEDNQMFAGKIDVDLCKQIKTHSSMGGFESHIRTDDRKFIDVAFEGTRGLNDTGQDMVDNYKPIPPTITHDELIKLATDWVELWTEMPFGEWPNPPECGCKPQQYALQLHYKSTVQSSQGGVTVEQDQDGQTDVPLEFHPQGEFSGSGTLSAVVKGFMIMPGGRCQAAGLNQMAVKVEGKVDQLHKNIHIKTAWASPGTHTTGTCTMNGITVSQASPGQPFDSSSLHDPLFDGFDMKDEVGTALSFSFPMMPGVAATVDTKLIEMTTTQ